MHGSRLKEVNSKTSVTCGIKNNDTVADFFISTIFSCFYTKTMLFMCTRQPFRKSFKSSHAVSII